MSTLLFAEAAKQRQMEVVNTARGLLDFDGGDPEMGLHLLNLHWNRQHHSFLVTYRPAFMRDMACQGPYFSKILLNAIYFGSAKFSPRLELRKDPDDVRTAGWRFNWSLHWQDPGLQQSYLKPTVFALRSWRSQRRRSWCRMN